LPAPPPGPRRPAGRRTIGLLAQREQIQIPNNYKMAFVAMEALIGFIPGLGSFYAKFFEKIPVNIYP
jgi:hypothetical protein